MKDLDSSPALPAVSENIKSIETESDATKTTEAEASTSNVKDGKASSSKVASSTPSTSRSASHADDQKQTSTELKEDDVKEEEDDKADVSKGSKYEEKMEVDSVKVEFKKEKCDIGKTTKSSRPSSTPPSNTGMIQ